jgi:nitric oxide dioxygenase
VTPEQITLVRRSLADLGPSKENLASEFYRQLFERDPSLRQFFANGSQVREAQFANHLTEVVDGIADFEGFSEETRHIGERNAEYGIRLSHYQAGRAALMAALEVLLGDRFDPATREAWTLACNLATECMMAGASKR